MLSYHRARLCAVKQLPRLTVHKELTLSYRVDTKNTPHQGAKSIRRRLFCTENAKIFWNCAKDMRLKDSAWCLEFPFT